MWSLFLIGVLLRTTNPCMIWQSIAIDPNASAARTQISGLLPRLRTTQERIARMEDQIARMNEELIALREQKIQAQRELHATKAVGSDSR